MIGHKGSPTPLPSVPRGSVVIVVSLAGGPGFVKRVSEMGIGPGSKLRVVKSGGPGPVIVEMTSSVGASGPRMALGLGAASRILVRLIDG